MAQKQLNLGILAHVDAGKTTLTERLLYEAGVIDDVGSVDDGTTQTDTLALEQQRGITIKSAVTSFVVDDVHVNLIDTPGHPDFIAEVERVLSVLDGAVLVISAVEGVQPQTRILMRVLERLAVPTLMFVNKIDRAGADDGRVLRVISQQLAPAIVPMGVARELGTRAARFSRFEDQDARFRSRLVEVLADRDDEILAAFVDDDVTLSAEQLRTALVVQTRRAVVHPVYFGSALTGAGVDVLLGGIATLLPTASGEEAGPVAGTVFKIERGPAGEKVAYLRMSSGTLRTRDRVHYGRDSDAKVTAIAVFERGPAVQRPSVSAGGIAKVWGLHGVRIGDRIGEPGTERAGQHFPPPALEAVIDPVDADERARLRVALEQLAEQDPLIGVRQDDARRELSVSLYGDVQKEVIQATLASDYGIDVLFREVTPIYVERPVGTGEAVEVLHTESNPYLATIGLRVEPAPDDSGVQFAADVDPRTAPLYLYKTFESFVEHMAEYVRETLRRGPLGWRVTDCLVTMTRCAYSIPDGPPSRRGPPSTAADFRKLTPLVLMQALSEAGTVLCEPVVRATLELPTDAIGPVMAALVRAGAPPATPVPRGDLAVVETVVPAARAQEVQRQLPALTRGEGVLDATFAGHRPVAVQEDSRTR